jgi:DNA repair protein RadA/Sms
MSVNLSKGAPRGPSRCDMAKDRSAYVCQQCGSVCAKWAGKCPGCGAWNSLVEEQTTAQPKSLQRGSGRTIAITSLDTLTTQPDRMVTRWQEFDRVTGGGLVQGGVILVGGDPGIGKSTLLLQIAAAVAQNNHRTLYVTGEEALDQVKMRAARLGLQKAPLELAAATHVTDILATLSKEKDLRLLLIDSIQTMFVDTLDAAPGTVSQVKAAAYDFIKFAKENNVTVIMVGHVTKEGTLAGPRVLEHMVDTVLYFEGERGHHFRILRGVKNRYGATDEIGVFEMTEAGLKEVLNPSALFLSGRDKSISGSVVYAGIEGTRPLLVEIQALVAPSAYGVPRRSTLGWDPNRLAMVIAVLETRCGITIGMRDVYLNVVGGLKISEPALDLPVAAALLSSLSNQPIPQDAIFCGEIGLSGEIRPIPFLEARLKEASKLGFEAAYAPHQTGSFKNISLIPLKTLQDLASLFGENLRQRKGKTHAA